MTTWLHTSTDSDPTHPTWSHTSNNSDPISVTWGHTSSNSDPTHPTWLHTSLQSDVSTPEWADKVWNQGSILTWTIHFGGSGYAIDDLIRLTLNGNAEAAATVTAGSFSNGRIITGLTFTSLGDDYLTDELCATTTDSNNGSGCTIKINSVTNTFNSIPLSATWVHTT
jgi:hypothetical protein